LAVAGVAAVGIWSFYRLIHLSSTLKKERKEAETTIKKAFRLLKGDLEDHISRLHRARSDRTLTAEELSFLEQFEKDLREAEDIIKEMVDSTSEQTREDLEEAAQAIRNDAEWKKYSKLIRRPNRGQMCVCGSGRRFESCHPRVLEGAIRLRAELERLNLNPYKLYRR
jgi:molecular chaperone DnaK (HSP70)